MSVVRRSVPDVNRTDRLYALVEELRAISPRCRSARELAATFEVSVHTVERDISALQQSGVPIFSQPGTRGGYVLAGTKHFLPNRHRVNSGEVAVLRGEAQPTP
jgi:predicted DNA-binding transcriptional regulator YafY